MHSLLLSCNPMCELIISVLIVDRDRELRQRVAEFLEARHYHVVQACCGRDAISAIRENDAIDLAVTDINLGEGSGFDVLEEANVCEPRIPVVFFSEGGTVRDTVEALRRGVANYLLKPLEDLELLHITLEKALHVQHVEHQNKVNQIELEGLNRVLSEKMRLLERDQNAGRLVQQKFLPPAPISVANLQIDYRLLPSLFLSGDSIDYGLLNDRFFAFYLTDIAGHGAASAFVAVWVHQLVRSCFKNKAIFSQTGSFEYDLIDLMHFVNNEIVKANIGPHLTCFVGIIDTETNEMVYVVAGHLPLPILKTSNETVYLEGKGKPLGLFPDAQWSVKGVKLPDQFQLMIFSDGVLEVLEPEDLIDKEQYLLRLLKAKPKFSFSQVQAVLKLEKIATVPDDIAMLLITKS